MTFFSHRPFLPFFTLPCFTDDDSYFLLFAHYTPLDSLYTHPHAVFHVLHLALCSRNIRYLFLLNSSLHKQPFITAHFRSSLHILCITAQCTLKQALLLLIIRTKSPTISLDLQRC